MIVLRFKLYLKLLLHGVTERGVDSGLLDSLDVIREKYVLPGLRLWILIVSIRIGLEPSFPISISQMMLKVLMKITPFEITTVSFLCLARQEKKRS